MLKYYFYRTDKKIWKTIFENMRTQLREMLSTQDICVELKKIRKQPSNEQRGYYWAIVLPAIKSGLYEYGNDQFKFLEEVHVFMKYQLKYYESIPVVTKYDTEPGIIFKSVGNSRGDKQETSKFIDECIRWAAENLGITIPEADKYGYKES